MTFFSVSLVSDWCRAQDETLKSKEACSFFDQGVEWFLNNEPDRAIESISEAIRLDPDFLQAYVARAHFWSAKSEFEKASVIALFQDAGNDTVNYQKKLELYEQGKPYRGTKE